MLDASLIEGFAQVYLWKSYDNPQTTPDFHRTMWEEASNEKNKNCAWAAPRGHAKSTSITLAFGLAAIVFRFRDHLMIVSDSEGQAVAQVKEIKNEILENESLCEAFGITGLLKDTETEIIVQFSDGYQCRVIAKGSEQRLRGLKWLGKRPNLVLGDDLEFDEIVSNPERLKKFKSWFFKSLIPSCAHNALIRIVGTILHHDSLLMNLMDDDEWVTHLWSAHEDFDDFTNILWPAQWTEERLRQKRQMFINQGQSDAYSQEYLNQPLASGHTFFDKADFKDLPQNYYHGEMGSELKTYYASVDLAVSQKQTADLAVITIATIDSDGYLDILDVRKGRFGPDLFVEEMFSVAEEYDIELWLVEKGAIQTTIMPFLNKEMGRRQRFFNMHFMTPTKDKMSRAQSIRARMKSGFVRFDKDADWWDYCETEMLHFPRGKHDDFVDTMSQLGLALESLIEPPSQDELDEEEYWAESRESRSQGQNKTTGY